MVLKWPKAKLWWQMSLCWVGLCFIRRSVSFTLLVFLATSFDFAVLYQTSLPMSALQLATACNQQMSIIARLKVSTFFPPISLENKWFIFLYLESTEISKKSQKKEMLYHLLQCLVSGNDFNMLTTTHNLTCLYRAGIRIKGVKGPSQSVFIKDPTGSYGDWKTKELLPGLQSSPLIPLRKVV